MAEGTCLHCGHRFNQTGVGRQRSWCFDCLPAASQAEVTEYQKRANLLLAFKRTGEHVGCCGLKRCKSCLVIYTQWHSWASNPGMASNRCQPCYLAYTRKRQTPNPQRSTPLLTHGTKPTGARWRRLQQEVWASETHCGLCGEPVDQALDHNHRMSRTIDHIIPIALGGPMYERANVQLAHRSCNAKAGATVPTQERNQLLRAALWITQRLTA